jgi:hypothetical protein
MNGMRGGMCWLCSYQGDPLGKQLNDFIIKNIGFMDMNCISQQVSDFLLLKQEEAQEATKEDIFTHIQAHMLHPKVRMAVMLRQMLELASLLQNSIVVRDGDLCSIDKSNAKLYLKIIGQIMSLYKADPQTMLFSDENMEGGLSKHS